MASIEGQIKELGAKLATMIKDFSKLKVSTYTVDPESKETMRAVTEVQLDGDMVLKIPLQADGAVAADILALHNDAVKNAVEARLKTIKAVVDAARAIVG